MAAEEDGPLVTLLGLFIFLGGVLGAALGFWLLRQQDASVLFQVLGLVGGAFGGVAATVLIFVAGPLMQLVEALLWLGYASALSLADTCLGWLVQLRSRLAARRPALPQDRHASVMAYDDMAASDDDMADGPEDWASVWHHVDPRPVADDRVPHRNGLEQAIPRWLRLFGIGSALLFAGVAALWQVRQGAASGMIVLAALGAALAGFYLSLLIGVACSLLGVLIGIMTELLANIAMRVILALPASWQRRAETAVFRVEGLVYLWVERPLCAVDGWMWPPEPADRTNGSG